MDSLVEQTLLEDHGGEAERVFVDSPIKIGVALLVEFEGVEASCKATISFGARVKDSSEATVHEEASELPSGPIEKRRRRGDCA